MEGLLQQIAALGLEPYREPLTRLVAEKTRGIAADAKGRRYLAALQQVPRIAPVPPDGHGAAVTIGRPDGLEPEQRQQLLEVLQQLGPWRKGPFNLFGIEIDSEWVSSRKWDRLKDRIAPLAGRKVLDIGSSNGYYLYRMAPASPQLLLGVEPYLTFYFQQRLLQQLAPLPNLHCLPVTFEELPPLPGYFDTVFSMGILSHRRAPLDTLAAMKQVLRRGGELVLETLVIPGEGEMALCPAKRYAKMNNVYFLPTVSCLCNWLARAGFAQVRCHDVSATTSDEQRKTPWIQTESLADFLDPGDPSRTLEGYPAPVRALVTARVP